MEDDTARNGIQKKVDVPVFISVKIEFKTETVVRDKDRHFIMIKERIHQEDITLINWYAPNLEAPSTQSNSQQLMGDRDKNTSIIGNMTAVGKDDSLPTDSNR